MKDTKIPLTADKETLEHLQQLYVALRALSKCLFNDYVDYRLGNKFDAASAYNVFAKQTLSYADNIGGFLRLHNVRPNNDTKFTLSTSSMLHVTFKRMLYFTVENKNTPMAEWINNLYENLNRLSFLTATL